MEPTSSLATALTLVALLTSTLDARAVVHDERTIWVGTTGGLVAVEGERTTTYGTAEGLPDGTIRALALDGDALWIGTDRGAASLDRRSRRVTRTVSSASPITAIARDAEGVLLGTLRGVVRVGADGSLSPIDGTSAPITDIVAHEERLIVATQGEGVHALEGGRLRRLGGDRLTWDLEVDGADVLVATSSGLIALRDGRRVSSPWARAARALPIRDVRAVRREGASLVVGTCGAGAFRMRGRAIVPIAGVAGCVRAIDVGPRGVVIASDRGVSTASGPLALGRGDALPDTDVASIARTREGLWVGTFRSGLALVRDDGTIETWNERSGLLDDRINRLAVDADGHLWIATDRGLVQRVGARFVVRGLVDRHVTLVARDGERIVAATGEDVYAWDPIAGQLAPLGAGRRAQDVARAPDGLVVIATAEGVVLGEGAARRTLTSGPGGLTDDWATALARHGNSVAVGTYDAGIALVGPEGVRTLRDDLWVNAGALASVMIDGRAVLAAGTLDDGLWLWDGTSWARIGVGEGLPDDDVTAVIDDGTGGLWVATRGGVAHLAAR